MTRPDAKDAVRYPCSDARASHAECRGRCCSHGLRTGIAVTAAKDRSVWTPRPPVGWPRWQVSWLAGRCPVASSLPGFPVAVRRGLAAHSCGGSHGLLEIRVFEFVESVFPLSSPIW